MRPRRQPRARLVEPARGLAHPHHHPARRRDRGRAARRAAAAAGRRDRRRHGWGCADHAVVADPDRARRRPDARQGHGAGHPRAVDGLPMPRLRPVRADRRAGAREPVRDPRDAQDHPPRRGLPGWQEQRRVSTNRSSRPPAPVAPRRRAAIGRSRIGRSPTRSARTRAPSRPIDSRRSRPPAGLDVAAWQACVATGDQQKAVRAETSQAVAGGVNATPTMNLNGQVIVGLKSVTELSALIEAAAGAAAGG